MDDNILFYIVDPADNYVYLRDVMKNHLKLSHSLLTKLKQQNKIQVNGQVCLTNYQLQAGDEVTVDIDLEEENTIEPEYIPLDVVYEDQDLLVINKPAGLAVHPVKGISGGTLANAVTCYWAGQGLTTLFRPINRLDKNTSGLILIGKSQYAHQAMYRQQKAGTISRVYQALVEGVVPEDRGCINLPIAHLDPRLCARVVDESGKPALTNYQVLKRYEGFTLLSLTLGTGRTHQIRVHLSQSGYPICGDTLYGTPSPLINRQALHAGLLTLDQPRTGTRLQFEVPLPADMVKSLACLGDNSKPSPDLLWTISVPGV